MKYVIFGVGMVTKSLMNADKLKRIDYFVDNDQSLHGETYLGKEIKKPDVLATEDKEDILVIISSFGSHSIMARQLEQMGFESGRNYVTCFQFQGDESLPVLFENTTWKQNEDHYSRTTLDEKVVSPRTFVALSMVDFTDARSVLNLGEGRRNVASILPENVGYIGVDYLKRRPETIVCDFDKREFPDVKADVVLILGCYEWIHEAKWLLRKAVEALNPNGQMILTSYYGGVVREFTGFRKNWANYFIYARNGHATD